MHPNYPPHEILPGFALTNDLVCTRRTATGNAARRCVVSVLLLRRERKIMLPRLRCDFCFDRQHGGLVYKQGMKPSTFNRMETRSPRIAFGAEYVDAYLWCSSSCCCTMELTWFSVRSKQKGVCVYACLLAHWQKNSSFVHNY